MEIERLRRESKIDGEEARMRARTSKTEREKTNVRMRERPYVSENMRGIEKAQGIQKATDRRRDRGKSQFDIFKTS